MNQTCLNFLLSNNCKYFFPTRNPSNIQDHVQVVSVPTPTLIPNHVLVLYLLCILKFPQIFHKMTRRALLRAWVLNE